MPLSRLIYFSENQLDPQKGSSLVQLSSVLKVSNQNNAARSITGALIFDDLWFIQTLEGERAKILETFERIKNDDRHTCVSLVELSDIDKRIFGNWWMGLATRNRKTQRVFEPYLSNGRLMPTDMTGKQLLALIVEVSKFGLNREILTHAA